MDEKDVKTGEFAMFDVGKWKLYKDKNEEDPVVTNQGNVHVGRKLKGQEVLVYVKKKKK
jgi:hypothetical protein